MEKQIKESLKYGLFDLAIKQIEEHKIKTIEMCSKCGYLEDVNVEDKEKTGLLFGAISNLILRNYSDVKYFNVSYIIFPTIIKIINNCDETVKTKIFLSLESFENLNMLFHDIYEIYYNNTLFNIKTNTYIDDIERENSKCELISRELIEKYLRK